MNCSKFHTLWSPAVICILSATGTVISPPRVCRADIDPECHVYFESDEHLLNWSSTHSSNVRKLYEPQNEMEVVRLLEHHSRNKTKLRPVGTALSPNGLGMPDNDTNGISLRRLSDIRVNAAQGTVTAGAGATVAALLRELAPHGLTLENFSSIQEQQLGGWTQVAAHGTGVTLSTVEEQIVEMRLVTPAHGVLTLAPTKSPEVFQLAKVGLGSLGVVSEVTLKCIPTLRLDEVTRVHDRESIDGHGRSTHHDRLLSNRHVRYMWLPYTDMVVSVTSKQCDGAVTTSANQDSDHAVRQPNSHMVALLQAREKNTGVAPADATALKTHSVAHLRELLLDLSPLSVPLIRDINRAEAEFWRGSQTSRVDDSVRVLGFDCGGEQWVLEACIPLGHLRPDNTTDLQFVRELLQTIEKEELPAASPIEQRWTARSTARMSPAFSSDPEDKFCWVGIIMYVPPSSQSPADREAIRQAFVRYCRAVGPVLDKYRAQVHWAKIELPDRRDAGSAEALEEELVAMRARLRRKFPVDEFCEMKRVLDPQGILSNSIVDTLFE